MTIEAFSHLSTDGQTLSAMHDAIGAGLSCMPAIKAVIVSLILYCDEALRQDARCLRPQCGVTDYLLTRAYDAVWNLSHLILALSISLQKGNGNADSITLCDASLEASGLMSLELGWMMSILVKAHHQGGFSVSH